ncbi:MAG: permease prefix domain 1-containing protein [Pirellulaceae bacterium]|nr:hypothetical protein [Planctomycetales bacterium]
MSEQEFENYLSLLCGMLRLGTGSRRQIADELRDHLEERVAFLRDAGVPDEQAVQQALEEFGDAASFATELVKVQLYRKKRWMMRMTIGGTATALAMAVLAFVAWPSPDPPSVRTAVAQAPARVPDTEGKSTRSAANARTRALIKAPTSVEFIEAPFEEFMQFLADKGGFQYYVDARGINAVAASGYASMGGRMGGGYEMESGGGYGGGGYGREGGGGGYGGYGDAGGEGMGEESAGYGGAPGNNGRQRVGRNVMEAPVTLKLRDVSIEMIMQLAMQQIGDHVTFSIREGVVVIGVQGRLPNDSETRVHFLSGLTEEEWLPWNQFATQQPSSPSPPPGSDAGVRNKLSLLHLIVAAVDRPSWDDPRNTIGLYGDRLVVTNSPDVHEKIESLLADLRSSPRRN